MSDDPRSFEIRRLLYQHSQSVLQAMAEVVVAFKEV